MGILAWLADCPPNHPKSGEEHKGRCVTHLSAPSREARVPRFFRVFYSVRPRRGRTRTDYSPTARRAGGGWKTIPCPGPEGQDGGRLFVDTSPSWPSIGPMVPFRALWLHSGLRLAYGSVPAPFWPYGSVLGFWLRVAQNKDAPARSIPGEASV